MPETSSLRHPEMFENYQLYFRTLRRNSHNYKELVKRIGREPNIVYPDGWYDLDIDRAILGKYGVHFGFEEYKHVNSLEEPFVWNSESQRGDVKEILIRSDFQIDYNTANFTIPGCKGVLSIEDNVMGLDDDYDNFLKFHKRLKIYNGESGKGIFLFTFYTDDLKYFSPINFTGSEIIFGEDGLGINFELKRQLAKVGEIIEPCFNEYLLFLVQAYIRQDFSTLYKYLANGSELDLIRYDCDWEEELSEEFNSIDDKIYRWYAFCDVMEWVLDCIHFDTIYENPKRYESFASRVRNGSIISIIKLRIKGKYKSLVNTRRSIRV